MRINTTVRYSVRALFDIAYHSNGGPAKAKEISKRQKISERYLEQIFKKLVAASILSSKRGPQGGYVLARRPDLITILDIITASQGHIVPVPCLAENSSSRGRACDMASTCVTRHVWRETQGRLLAYFDSITIADLCDMASKKGISVRAAT